MGQPTRQRQGAYRESLPGPRRLIYPCKDDDVVLIFFGGAIGGRNCRRLVQWMDEAGCAPAHMLETDWDTWDDVYLADLGEQAHAEIDRVERALADFLARFTMRQLYQQALHRRLLLAPVAHAQTIMDDPQLTARAYFTPLSHPPVGSTVSIPGPFARFSATPLRLQYSAPGLGADNRDILTAACAEPAESSEVSTASTVHSPPLPWPPLPPSEIPASPQPNKQPLHNVRVLDLSWYGVGPLSTKYLADHGAEVIKVESALRPDGLRQAPPWHGSYTDVNSSQFFANYNTSKRSIALNLETPEARQLLLRLVHEWADIVVESFTPGTVAKWGLDYPSLQQRRPDLIMLSTCMQGQTGPHARYYDGHQFLLSASPGALWSPAPLLGQHTVECLRTILHVPTATIARWQQQGVLQ